MSTATQFERRSLDPVAQALIRRLIVPRIYFEARWPTEDCLVDLVAIDRAGSGDVHVVEVKRRFGDAVKALASIRGIPAHFRWVSFRRPNQRVNYHRPELYAPNGEGRIGLIEIVSMPDETLGAHIVLPAERSYEKVFELADRFKDRNHPDIEFD